jgi:hypothetical protein
VHVEDVEMQEEQLESQAGAVSIGRFMCIRVIPICRNDLADWGYPSYNSPSHVPFFPATPCGKNRPSPHVFLHFPSCINQPSWQLLHLAESQSADIEKPGISHVAHPVGQAILSARRPSLCSTKALTVALGFGFVHDKHTIQTRERRIADTCSWIIAHAVPVQVDSWGRTGEAVGRSRSCASRTRRRASGGDEL